MQRQQGVPAGVAVFWPSSGLQPEPAGAEAGLPYHPLLQQLAPASEPVASNHTDTNDKSSSNKDSIIVDALVLVPMVAVCTVICYLLLYIILTIN